MTDLPEINVEETLIDAFVMGCDEFSDYDGPEYGLFGDYTSTARYANIICPKLREMAGFGDVGPGTFAHDRDVVLVNTDGTRETVSASTFLEEVSDQFFRGATDAVNTL